MSASDNFLGSLRKMIFRGYVLEDYYMDSDGNPYKLTAISINKSSRKKYPRIAFTLKGKRKTVDIHQIVASTFGIKKTKPAHISDTAWEHAKLNEELFNFLMSSDVQQINHIDQNPENFHPSNLEYCVASANRNAYHASPKAKKRLT